MQVNVTKVAERYVYMCLFLKKEASPHSTSHQPGWCQELWPVLTNACCQPAGGDRGRTLPRSYFHSSMNGPYSTRGPQGMMPRSGVEEMRG